MNKSQANRAVIAARTAPATPNQIAMLRPVPVKGAVGPVRRVRATKMTGLMRAGDDSGRRSGWTRPANLPYPVTVITCDKRWSA